MKVLSKILEFVVFILLVMVIAILSVLFYVKRLWPNADYEQIMVTLKDIDLKVVVDNALPMDWFWGFLFFIIVFPICYFGLNLKKQILACICGGVCILYFSGCFEYLMYSNTQSLLYEERYIKPLDIEYKFPHKKRNLLLIYMESFENNYKNADFFDKNLIPNLEKLQNEGEFSNEHRSLPGADYSIAALVASQCAIPLRFNKNRDLWEAKFFLPGALCVGDILKNNGYQTALVKAADITFTNVNLFALQHGYIEASGVDEIKKDLGEVGFETKIGAFGGVRDRVLWDYAKSKLDKFDKDKPFMLTLFSLDTHGPTVFVDKDCKREFNDVRDAFMCADRGVYEFIEWFKTSEYWDNTTVVIVGDHLMATRMKGLEKDRNRGIYNVFLNLPKGLEIKKDKVFSTYDLAPSIIEALGGEINPRGFGLGRSMFSDDKTLMEDIGRQQFRTRLMQKSLMYEEFTRPNVERVVNYKEYKMGDVIKGREFLEYTDSFVEALGRYYIDRMNVGIYDYKGGNLKGKLKFYAIMGYDSALIIYVNDVKIKEFKFDRTIRQPFEVDFEIDSKLINDGKFVLKTRNSSGVSIEQALSISPEELVFEEIK